MQTGKRGKVTLTRALPLIQDAFANGIAKSEFGSGAGCAAECDEITVWWPYNHETKTYSTDAYIVMTLENLNLDDQPLQVPKTNKRDVFGEPSQDHGGFAATLPMTTKTDIAELEQHLIKFIDISAKHPEIYPVPKVTTNGFGKGIYLTKHTMEKMADLKIKFIDLGVKMHWKKKSGKQGVDVVLTEITWAFADIEHYKENFMA